MKKVISLSIMLAFVLMMKAQEKVYQPTWESLVAERHVCRMVQALGRQEGSLWKRGF